MSMNSKTQQIKNCEHCKHNFTISEGELVLYKKVGLEPSTLCFFCRTRLQLSFWIFGKFRKGKSDLSGASLITVLPENKYPIYTLSEWHSDKWDPIDYGTDYDPNVSFFAQLKILKEKVPRPHQVGTKNTGCDWCDDVWESKNCYLSRSMIGCEDLFYSYRNLNVRNSIDMNVCFESEKCYDCGDCHNSYKLFYSRHCKDCIESSFLYDCRNCQNCFMSWNLRNKSFCIENVQYSKEEYEEKIQSFNLGSYEAVKSLKERFAGLVQREAVHRENFNLKSYNSTGNFLIDDKDCINCNTISDSEECRNCVRGFKLKSAIDMTGCWKSELIGNCCKCESSYDIKHSTQSSSRYSEYVDLCIECEYCFGCVGLKKKKYCILNKQFTKKEYESLKGKIISDMKERGEYGKFFPYSMSDGPFNFSSGILYFPETKKEDILNLGGSWEDINESQQEGMSTAELLDSINDVTDAIITQALVCPETGWRFNINKNELDFYRTNNIPLPRYHFDARTKKALKYLTILKAYPYTCFYCKKDIEAYYLPEWGYKKIACEECYKQNIA